VGMKTERSAVSECADKGMQIHREPLGHLMPDIPVTRCDA